MMQIQFTVMSQAQPKQRPRFRVITSKIPKEDLDGLEYDVSQNRFTAAQLFARFIKLINDVKPPFASAYTAAETVEYEKLVALHAKRAMAGRPPTDRGVEMRIELHMKIPVSWSKKKQAAALAGDVLATKKPDSGNMQKAIEDAMNEIVYLDDSQIVTHTVWKKYSDQPRIVVAVRDLPGDPA